MNVSTISLSALLFKMQLITIETKIIIQLKTYGIEHWIATISVFMPYIHISLSVDVKYILM